MPDEKSAEYPVDDPQPAPPAPAADPLESIVTEVETKRLRGAAALSAAGIKVGGRPKGARDLKPRKRRSDLIPVEAPTGELTGKVERPLLKVQAVFASIWCSGQVHDDATAVEQAYESCKLEKPSRGACRKKAERWLASAVVRAEIERVAQLSSTPAAALAAIARRQLKGLLFAEDEHVRHQAVVTALKLNGDMRDKRGGGLEGGRDGVSIGAVIIQKLGLGEAVSQEELGRALRDALDRSVKPNEISVHRHAEGQMPLLPPGRDVGGA